MQAICLVFKFIMSKCLCLSKKRVLPESIENIRDRLTDPYYQGWKSVKPKSLLDNSYRTMLCLFKECFSKEDDNYDCKWMELIVCFYICRTVEYWSAKHWSVKRPSEVIQQTETTLFLHLEFFWGMMVLTYSLRVWGKTVEVHLMIATTWNSWGILESNRKKGSSTSPPSFCW